VACSLASTAEPALGTPAGRVSPNGDPRASMFVQLETERDPPVYIRACGTKRNKWTGKQRQLRAPSPDQTVSRGVKMLSQSDVRA
jgi:hypothetical protein